MVRYLSLDTEATGLEDGCLLLQLAVVPVDVEAKKILVEHSMETLVQCPSFETLKPTLNEWVLQHNETLIRDAHAKGIPPETLPTVLGAYLDRPEIKEFFKKDRPVFMGKSLSALDIPLLTRYLGGEFMRTRFHHHTVDITSIARFLVNAGKLPAGCESTSRIIRHFGIREDARHTALSDAVDMAEIYFRLIDLLKPQTH